MNYLFADLSALELFFVIFHHVYGSTSFSIVQFSRSCLLSSRTAQSLYQRSYFLSSTFFNIFLSFPNAFLKAFHPHAIRFPAAFFAGTSLLFGFWRAAVLRDSLFIIPHFQPLSTPFFDFLHNFFDLFLGRVHMDALTWFLYSFSFCPRFLSFSPTSSYNTNSLLHPLLPHLFQIIYLPYLRFGSKASILKSVI